MIAMFMESRLEGRQIMVCPTNTKFKGDFETTRTLVGSEIWPVGTRRVILVHVSLPPIRSKVSVSTLPPVSGAVAQPGSTRGGEQPGSERGCVPVAKSKGRSGYTPASSTVAGFTAVPHVTKSVDVVNATTVNGVTINIVKRDMVGLVTGQRVQSVVNDAETDSFRVVDENTSGDLRDAMYPRYVYDDCINLKNNRSKMSASEIGQTVLVIENNKMAIEESGNYTI